jgi:hypothetical protein
MIIIENASIYSTNGDMAYEIQYSDGTTVRVLVSNSIIRKEWKKNGEWVLSGKPYKVVHNKRRNAERIVETVKNWIGA